MVSAQDDSEPSGQALPVGARLLEFIIERVLGSGGFGITYLAKDTSLNRQVVIKENLPAQFAWRETTTGTVRPRHTSGSDADDYAWSMNNFLREAETLASLDHPGIVRVLRKFEANGTAYFVMPFVDGVALDVLIEDRRAKQQPFSDEEIKGLLDRLLDALGYLHDRGIYHRDIKPGNILISNQGVPALIDFGSARQRLSERSMTVVESAGYTPFEQLQSRGNVGPWSDLYALGATIVKAITFETLPKAADRVMDDPWQGLVNHLEASHRYSFSLLDSIDRAVQVAPGNRWQDAREWQGGLRERTKPSPTSIAVMLPPPAPAYPPRPQHGGLTTTSRLVETDETANPGAVAVPALWNPITAVNLGVILTPAFGAFLHARNSKALEHSAEGKSGMYWFYGMAACGFFGMLFAGSLIYFMSINLLVLIVWYFISAKKQIRFVEATFGKSYSHKSFGKPLLAGIGSLVAAVIFVEGLHSLGRDGAVPVPAGEVSALDDSLDGLLDRPPVTAGEVSPADAEVVTEKAEDAVSLFNRGVAYANGDGVSQDLTEAVKWYRKAADLGYSDAMNNLGLCFDQGAGVAQDHAEAVIWFRKAAEQGNALAQLNLGLAHIRGEGASQDMTRAVEWFRKAAEQGDARSQYFLGICYGSGEGVEQDQNIATEWFRKAATGGDSQAMTSIGLNYQDGLGVAKDEQEAATWYRKASEAGDSDGMWRLGLMCLFGTGVAEDKTEAAKWFRKAAEADNPEGMWRIGLCLKDGNGVDQNEAEAVAWFRKAAEQKNAVAQCNLGDCYFDGKGIAENKAVAVQWYRSAAESGYAVAQLSLGICYDNGEGIIRDDAEAVKWYRLAAEQGNAKAQLNLGACYDNGEGIIRDDVEAVKWYRMAANQGDATAQYNLAICYHTGEGITQDRVESANWIRKAAEQGHEGAKKVLAEGGLSTVVPDSLGKPAMSKTPQQESAVPVNPPPTDYPIAQQLPNKPGFVFSPYNNKVLDVQDIPRGTLVEDPTSSSSTKKYFRVP